MFLTVSLDCTHYNPLFILKAIKKLVEEMPNDNPAKAKLLFLVTRPLIDDELEAKYKAAVAETKVRQEKQWGHLRKQVAAAMADPDKHGLPVGYMQRV